MAKTKEPKEQLSALSTILKTSAETIWKAFVMRYVAMGLGFLLVAVFISLVSIRLLGTSSLWLLAPATVVAFLLYGAIMCLVNPTYYAMMDAMNKVKNLREPDKVEVVNSGGRSY